MKKKLGTERLKKIVSSIQAKTMLSKNTNPVQSTYNVLLLLLGFNKFN